MVGISNGMSWLGYGMAWHDIVGLRYGMLW